MGASLDGRERSQLCDLFLEVGPDAPTLCEGWTTADLAAHLVIRERDPRAGVAILGRGERSARIEERLMGRTKSRGYETMVNRLRSGPPLHWKVPGLRTLMNLNEWFVHHEDVRRANDHKPRTDVDELEAALWRSLGASSRLMVGRMKGAGLELVAPGYGKRQVRRGEPTATVTGMPQELVLFVNGRGDAAQVEVTGPSDAVDALNAARLGL